MNDDKKTHKSDVEIEKICQAFIIEDIRITHRAVAKKLKCAHSTILRNKKKREQIERGQELQKTVKSLTRSQRKSNSENVLISLAEAKQRVKFLENDITLLIASHRAMILAVGELGGTRAWLRFFEDHKSALDRVKEIGALPPALGNHYKQFTDPQ